MVDWGIVAKVTGGGFGVTILVLIILSLIAWLVGLVVQKTAKPTTEGKEVPAKGK
jgi:Na+-transporting methylmalonyl-CoA/oxaloacetate decarboxylase gamma subunit